MILFEAQPFASFFYSRFGFSWQITRRRLGNGATPLEGVTKLVCAKCEIIGKKADFPFLFPKCVFLEDAKSLEIQEIFHPSTTLRQITAIFCSLFNKDNGLLRIS